MLKFHKGYGCILYKRKVFFFFGERGTSNLKKLGMYPNGISIISFNMI